MERSLNDFMWFDPRFIEENGEVNESNCFEYFMEHPEFDRNCLNLTHKGAGQLSSTEVTESGLSGVFYETKKVGQTLLIVRNEAIKGRVLFAGVHFFHGGYVFGAKNLKELLYRKTGNAAALLSDLATALAEVP